MLDVVCNHAQNVILDRTLFQLDQTTFNQFTELLEQSAPNLEKLMATKSSWEQVE